MKENTMISCYDELISNLILLSSKNIVYINYIPTQESKIETPNTSISILSDIKDKRNEYSYWDKLQLEKFYKREYAKAIKYYESSFSLTSHEIIIYLILLHKYLVDKKDIQVITLKEIHKRYRAKRTLDSATRNTYLTALTRLKNRKISYSVKKRSNKKIKNKNGAQNLVTFLRKEKMPDGNLVIFYTLGDFGKILLSSKRFSNIAPAEIFRVSFNQINFTLISLYLSRLVFINKYMKKAEFKISLPKIMENIYSYDIKGNNTGMSYRDLIELSSIPNKGKKLALFIENVWKALSLLENNNSIKNYYITNHEINNIRDIDSRNYSDVCFEIILNEE